MVNASILNTVVYWIISYVRKPMVCSCKVEKVDFIAKCRLPKKVSSEGERIIE